MASNPRKANNRKNNSRYNLLDSLHIDSVTIPKHPKKIRLFILLTFTTISNHCITVRASAIVGVREKQSHSILLINNQEIEIREGYIEVLKIWIKAEEL